MYAIIYEIESTGYYLGADTTFQNAEIRFTKIVNDLVKSITKHEDEDFFYVYVRYKEKPFWKEYYYYTISDHKNKIKDYKLIFQMDYFCLYVVEIKEKFSPNNLNRIQNHIFFMKNRCTEDHFVFIMN
ncbi:MAG: hypothetical protein JSS94_03200 [Bacteroidetes bacterium]|nr:hypothetical protein [Bacteroidota bacterium]